MRLSITITIASHFFGDLKKEMNKKVFWKFDKRYGFLSQ